MKIGKLIAVILLLVGIVITIIGIWADTLIGGNPGMSPPQLMLIVGGVGISLVGVGIFFERIRRALSRNLKQIVLISVPTLIILVVILEVALTLAGFDTRYPNEIPESFAEEADWWVCDDLGCHFETEARARACVNLGQERTCLLNSQGFHDTDEFAANPVLADADMRILALGDSFTMGASASIGRSFVEILESELPNTVLWNASLLGSGTNQQAEWLEIFAPMLQPDVVLLGFFTNDFEDNVYPNDSYFWGTGLNGERLAIRQYRLDAVGNVTPITSERGLYYRLHSVEEPPNELVRLVGLTRLGSLVLDVAAAGQQIWIQQDGRRWQVQVDATRNYLQAIRDYTAEHDITLLVLMIPARQDLQNPSQLYQAALDLFEELDLVVLNPIHLLQNRSYSPPDVHWNNAGHELIGQQLVACFQQLQSTGSVDDCVEAFETRVNSSE